MNGTGRYLGGVPCKAPHNTSLQWTRDNVTHFARRKMRAIAARH